MTSHPIWDDISKIAAGFPRKNEMTSQKSRMTSQPNRDDISLAE
jgi:hypothetical protein